MKLKPAEQADGKFCTLPRKPEAIKALLVLAWKKSKKESREAGAFHDPGLPIPWPDDEWHAI